MDDIDKKIKEIVKSNLERMGSLSINEIIEIIRPYYEYDIHQLVEMEMRRAALRIVGCIRDTKDERIYYLDDNGNIKNIYEM